MTAFFARRICWPEPDATCLEGGCGWCHDKPFVAGKKIQEYVESTPQVCSRYGRVSKSSLEAYEYGLTNPNVKWRGGHPYGPQHRDAG